MAEQRSASQERGVSPEVTVVYAQVNRNTTQRSKINLHHTGSTSSRARHSSKEEPLIEEEDVAQLCEISQPSACVMLMQTPEQEKMCGKHLVVADTTERKKTKEKKKLKSSSSTEPEQVSYRVTSYDTTVEYRELDPRTLTLHYGDVTPYGTIAPGYVETDGRASSASDRKHRRRGSSESFSTSVYSSLLRTSDSGVHKLKLGEQGIYYEDFMPKMVKENFCRNDDYTSFADCVDEANTWLSENRFAVINRCESLRHRLDHQHRFNPESTATHDRSFVIGLRLWYYIKRTEYENPVKLAYKNIVPKYLHDAGEKSSDQPEFEDLPTLIKRMNEELKKELLNGHLLDIETLPINSKVAYRSDGSLDPDTSYCCVDSQSSWELHILRLFYIHDDSHHHSPTLECYDFAPKATALPPSPLQFESMSTVLKDASNWADKHPTKNIWAVEVVELTFNMDSLVSSQGVIDARSLWRKTNKSSARRHTLKVVRVWVSDGCRNVENFTTGGGNQYGLEFDLLTFVPRQLTTSGCCGANKALFVTSRDTVEKINDWVNRSGAEIIDIQTDNIEKWQKSSKDIHEDLPDRTYNKEDFSNPCLRSALECRVTVFRVYYRPRSLSHLYTANPDKPVQPFCCFVGCNIL